METSTPLEEPVPQHLTPTYPPTDETEISDATDIDPMLQQLSSDGVTWADEFNYITASFGRQANSDNNDGDEKMPLFLSIKINELFDFTQRSWISPHERSASRSLNEELELYELLDLDAAGEEGVDVEINHTLDSILHHV